jgi:hypothetical protein
MSNGQGAQIADLQLVVADWYRKRLGNFFRRTLNQGLGAYLVFAVSLTITLISARLAWVGGMEDREYVSGLMKTEIQPQSDATRGVVMSLLLAGLDTADLSDQLYCNGLSLGACNTGTKLWKTTQGLVDAVERAQDGRDPEWLRLKGVAGELHVGWTGSQPDVIEQRLRDNLAERKRILESAITVSMDVRDDVGDPCGPTTPIAQRAQSFYLSPPFCISNAADLTIQVIPQQVADALDVDAAMKPDSVATEPQSDTGTDGNAGVSRPTVKRLRDFRVLRAKLDSDLFDVAVGSMRDLLIAADSKAAQPKASGPTIAAAFFISVDSVIRYWSKMGEVGPASLPAHRLWAARPYFEKMLNDIDSDAPLITRAYMDFAGNGVVYTECHSLVGNGRLFPERTELARSAPLGENLLTKHEEKRERVVLGAVCVDYALSDEGVEKLIKKVDSGPVADANRVVFGMGAGGKWTPQISGQTGWTKAPALEHELESAANEFSTDAASRRDIRAIDADGLDASVFLIPLRVRRDGKLDAILLKVKGVGPLGSRPEVMIFTAIFGAIAIGSLLAGFRSSKAVATRERLLGRLRSLQVGVVQTDGHDEITAANDRAEELLDRPMPPFGIEALDNPRFWDVFERDSILMDATNLNFLSGQFSPHKLSLGTAEEIKEDRRLGKTTAYFVKLARERSACGVEVAEDESSVRKPGDGLSPCWLRITAGPILMPLHRQRSRWRRGSEPGNLDAEETFGVIEAVSFEFGETLSNVLARLRVKKGVAGENA